jgi:hypothetical protein
MSDVNYRSDKLLKTVALKRIRQIARSDSGSINFTSHAEIRMKERWFSAQDVMNVLCSPSTKIYDEPEFENGSYRYRLQTKNMHVVVSFSSNGIQIWIVTVIRKNG